MLHIHKDSIYFYLFYQWLSFVWEPALSSTSLFTAHFSVITTSVIYSHPTLFCTFYDLNGVESQVEIFDIHETQNNSLLQSEPVGENGKE